MSALTSNILKALISGAPTEQQPRPVVRNTHYGFPRGYKTTGGLVENSITKLVEWLSCTKYGPTIRDHVRVSELLLLQKNTTLDYAIFSAPNMVGTPARGDYYGKDDSVDIAIQSSRVWDAISIHDAAVMLLSHLMLDDEKPMPKQLCISYQKRA
jgi:hypothetical protein